SFSQESGRHSSNPPVRGQSAPPPTTLLSTNYRSADHKGLGGKRAVPWRSSRQLTYERVRGSVGVKEEEERLSEVANKEAKDEITDHTVYKRLAESERKPEFKEVYSKLAETEYKHYSFWKKYATSSDLSPDRWKLFIVLFI